MNFGLVLIMIFMSVKNLNLCLCFCKCYQEILSVHLHFLLTCFIMKSTFWRIQNTSQLSYHIFIRHSKCIIELSKNRKSKYCPLGDQAKWAFKYIVYYIYIFFYINIHHIYKLITRCRKINSNKR